MYEYLHDYTRPKNGGKTKLCSTDADSLIVQVKSKEVYAELAKRYLENIRYIKL